MELGLAGRYNRDYYCTTTKEIKIVLSSRCMEGVGTCKKIFKLSFLNSTAFGLSIWKICIRYDEAKMDMLPFVGLLAE